jgi:hypothetical protein
MSALEQSAGPTPAEVTAAFQRVSDSFRGKAPELTRDELLQARTVLASGTKASTAWFSPALVTRQVVRIDARLHALDTGEPLVEPTLSRSENIKGTLALLGMIGLVVAVVWWIIAAATSEDEDDGPSDVGAFYACQHFVEQVLKAPSTADFGLFEDSRVAPEGDDRYTVRGLVDAENSFGVPLRSTYTCEVKYAGGSWLPVSVPTLD